MLPMYLRPLSTIEVIGATEANQHSLGEPPMSLFGPNRKWHRKPATSAYEGLTDITKVVAEVR